MVEPELIAIDKQLTKIEDTIKDFRQNDKWKQLKARQTELFLQKAKDELFYRQNKVQNEHDIERIKVCQKFIDSCEKETLINS